MSTIEMDREIKELRELRRMSEELAAEMEAIQARIKSEMTARGVDTLAGSDWKVTWKTVTSSRFDSKAFQSTHAELYAQYSKPTTSRRFVLA